MSQNSVHGVLFGLFGGGGAPGEEEVRCQKKYLLFLSPCGRGSFLHFVKKGEGCAVAAFRNKLWGVFAWVTRCQWRRRPRRLLLPGRLICRKS